MGDCYIFHVQLDYIDPSIWRRLEIRREKTFWDLHCAIQDAMPWDDKHLHEFRLLTDDKDVRIGIPDFEAFDDIEILSGWETRLKDWFVVVPSRCSYVYDFGDDWQHTITLEGIKPAEKGGRYPRCTAGERSCPPEDVGGAPGYEEFLKALADPRHPEHETYRTWIGRPWDPEFFEVEEVTFSRPSTRLRSAGLA